VIIREKISDLSLDVNDFLRGYVYVHDYVFAGSIRHIIPIPFFFKAIDFAKALSAIELADLGLEKSVTTARQLIESSNVVQAEYLQLMIEYVVALRTTINLFRVILIGLDAKLIDRGAYNWRTYRRDVAAYKESIAVYVSLGGPLKQKLNSLGT
jgi:hypothetical protein